MYLSHFIHAQQRVVPRYAQNPVEKQTVGRQFAPVSALLAVALSATCHAREAPQVRAITDRPLASGTNVDDLSDYRPGLQAAAEREVVHPFVDAGIDKRQIRDIARHQGLDCAELPAQPCLASRIETGIPIRAPDLGFVDQLEARLRAMLGEHSTVRVRVRASGVHVELGGWPAPGVLSQLEDLASAVCAEHAYRFVAMNPYRQGSAFVAEG